MAGRDSRRRPGMTVGQRMRDFSRSVMRHYASLPDDLPNISPSVPQASPVVSPPDWTEPAETPAADTQMIASAPLPFDAPITERTASLLPSADLPVYAPDPPLPQYVVSSEPSAPPIQRTEQPAQPASNVAVGPDGRPLIYKGKPVPVDPDPTPPALLELMQRQRQRDAEVQRLKEERSEKLKAELPPTPEDADVPRSSRIRRRGSADVDYIQTKALADKREPGDTGAPPAKNVKSPREPEKQESQALDDDDESNGDTVGSPPLDAPTDAAPSSTQPADISTVSDSLAVQRVPDTGIHTPSIPFDAPIDAPLVEPDVTPEIPQPPQPFAEPQSPVPTDVPAAPLMAVQRQTEQAASRHPVSYTETAQNEERPYVSPAASNVPQLQPSATAQTPLVAVQRQVEPEITPSLPFDTPTVEQPDTPEVSRPLAVDAPEAIPSLTDTASPSMPSAVQRQTEARTPAPSLPFDAHTTGQAAVPEDGLPQAPTPAVQRQADTEAAASSLPFDEPVITETVTSQAESPTLPDLPPAQRVIELEPAPSNTAPQAPVTAIQREPETDITVPSLPLDVLVDTQTVIPGPAQPTQSTPLQTPSPADSLPLQPMLAVQRQAHAKDAAASLPFDTAVEKPRALDTLGQQNPLPEATPETHTPAIQRQAETDAPAPSLPFDVPSEQPVAGDQPREFAAPDVIQPSAAAELQTPADIQRQQEPEAAAPRAAFDISQPPAPEGTPSQTSKPAIQRHPESETAAPPLPFDAPRPEQPAVSNISQQAASPAVLRQSEAEVSSLLPSFDAPLPSKQTSASEISQPSLEAPAEDSAPQAPSIQRQADSKPVVAVQDARQSVDTPAQTSTPLSESQPEVAVPAPQTPSPAMQRKAEIDAVPPLPFDAPAAVPSDVQQAGQPAAQISETPQAPAEPSPPASAIQREPAADVSVPQSTTTAPIVQRQSEVESTLQTPFDAPQARQAITPDALQPEAPGAAQTPTQATASSTPAPAIQRQADVKLPESPIPFDAPPSTEQVAAPLSEPVTSDTSTSELPSAANMPTTKPASAAPAVQRQADTEAPISPLPFDMSPAEQPAVPQAQPAAAPDISEPEQVGAPQTLTPTATPAVQRQVGLDADAPPLPFDIPISKFVDEPETEAARQAAISDAVQIPSQMAVQRQAEIPISAPAVRTADALPAALPFDDLDTIAVQRVPVEQVAQLPQPIILPFDPVASADSPDIQRTPSPEPSDPFSTPSTMPAGVPAEDRMDVFQALVAAGMVSRPPGGSTMPVASQPLMQRSPSREAYLANMAQRQESAGAVTGPIQRALGEDGTSNPPEPKTENDEAPEINLDQLASDVMRVLRGKLRSEHERLSKR
jgi:hypothetical protein